MAVSATGIRPSPSWRNRFQRYLQSMLQVVLYDGNNPPALDNSIIGFVSPSHTYSGSVTGPGSIRIQ